MKMFRMMLMGTAAVGLTAAAMSTASAGEVEKSMGVSGHVNRAVVVGDDGEDGFILHNDPHNISQSRIRAKASAKSESLTIGATIELGVSSGASVTQDGASTASNSFRVRHSFVHLSNSMGKLRIGQTAHANDTLGNVDMSSTGNAESFDGSVSDGVLFHTTGSLVAAAGVSVATANGGVGSSGRLSGISYDSPNLSGFGVTVSHTHSGSGSGILTYNADFDGVAVKAQAGAENLSGETNDSTVRYGLGFKLANGLNLSGTYAKISRNSTNADVAGTATADPVTIYAKLGYDLAVSDMGKTGLAVSYRNAKDTTLNGDKFKQYSFLVSQSLTDYGTTVYGGLSQYEYDTTAGNFDDITAGFMGVKVVF
jgi:hypothetical protein